MRGFKYILFMLALVLSADMWGQYNPTSPAEPGALVAAYALTLSADPSGGGSFNLNSTTSYAAGTTISLRAYSVSNFSFVSWEENGKVISTSASFSYTMPAHDVSLIAHYNYAPGNPKEPSEPDIPAKPVYSNIYLTASPTGGGSFNITSGNSYEVGTSVKVQANPASNFTFVNWTKDGEEIATSRTFNYTMLEGVDANRLVANFNYTPGNPGEPAEPAPKKIYHRVFLESDPVGGGYFNTESGNQFEEGTSQTFRAYNNQWYTFVNWTKDGVEVSTNSSYTMTIPEEDVTLTAHYTYNYNPGSPGEPSQSTEQHLSIYGMTSVGAAGQSVLYPVFLENTEEVYSVTVVMSFPEGFTPKSDNVMAGERAANHKVTVTAMEDNKYRIDVTGDQLLTGSNGKIFEIPVTIGSSVAANQSHQVVLSNGARINKDGSKEVIATRSGYIFVEEMKEDGLYAQFSYEKLQGRVKFSNLSSDRAKSYQWDFGDGTSSTEKEPLHIYAKSGYYDVELTVKGETGTDRALMTVLINDESTWQVDGVFFLDSEQKGVRYFTTSADLFDFMSAYPIVGDIKVMVKPGMSYDYALTTDHISKLQTIQTSLAEKGFTLAIQRSGDGNNPTLNFGAKGAAIAEDVVDLFIALGKHMTCEDVHLKLWNIGFDPSKLDVLAEQSQLSGQPTTEVDFAQVSTDLTFKWTATSDTETASGYPKEGQGNIPSMTAISGSATDCHLIYNIEADYQGTHFFDFTHTVTLKPALEGKFENLSPADNSRLETTTVQLTWDKINNAVYDVYLWNATNKRPEVPVAEGITEQTYTSQNFCQNEKSYKWQIVARNAFQELASDTMHFTVKMLPDLHIHEMSVNAALKAGNKVTISWTVGNDGTGATGSTAWTDRVWLVPDVYTGTAQTNVKQLAAVSRVKALAPGEQYTGSVEVLLDEQTWGNYYLLVASDMSSVTNIDWTSVGGSIVNPYQPTLSGDGYVHLFGTTDVKGNVLEEHGETSTRSDNFFYLKVEIEAPSVNESDWNLLQTVYAEMGSGEGWNRTWNFNSTTRSLAGLGGVKLSGGRVTSIDLSSNNLSGTFPYRLLLLPKLKTLNLSGNNLTGDIGSGLSAFAKTLTDNTQSIGSALTTLNMSSNQLSGNIGLFADYLKQLTTLDASKNKLEAVSPVISSRVTSLNLNIQAIDKAVPLHLGQINAESLATWPSILFYQHKTQSYTKDFRMLIDDPDGEWNILLAYQNGVLSIAKVSEQNTYRGASGRVLSAKTVDSANRETGTTFSIKFNFDEGDANFNGEVDVLDLQTMINYIFESYQELPFNFTAANLDADHDQVINVQDVVGMVNLLMAVGNNTSAVRRSNMTSAGDAVADASLSVQDGQLLLESARPVAAFDIVVKGTAADVTLADHIIRQGITCSVKQQGECVHLIGYSMAGATIPVGTTQLCSLGQSSAEVVYAKLADSHARAITVRIDGGAVTSIDESMTEPSALRRVYNMAGQCVDNGQRTSSEITLPAGLYIVNGKKLIIKKK